MPPNPRPILLALCAFVLGGAFLAWLLDSGDSGTTARNGAAAPSASARTSGSGAAPLPDAITLIDAPDRSRRRGAAPRRPLASASLPPPAPVLPGELGAFETVPYPLGKPAYGGEPVTAYLRVASLDRELALSVNQGGEFPRVPVLPGETVQVRLAFAHSPPDTPVALSAEDGGVVAVDGRRGRSRAGKLDGRRQLGLSYRVSETAGVHRVALRTPGGETKVLEFWAGDPPPRKPLP
ncbi:MAG: hypothetical protein WD342_16690 [Verrucomicrobiales bacterium]